MRCPKCGGVIPGKFPYCDYCGAFLGIPVKPSFTPPSTSYLPVTTRRGVFSWPSWGWQLAKITTTVLGTSLMTFVPQLVFQLETDFAFALFVLGFILLYLARFINNFIVFMVTFVITFILNVYIFNLKR